MRAAVYDTDDDKGKSFREIDIPENLKAQAAEFRERR